MSKNVECVRVVVRCRPLSPTEVQDGREMIVQMFTNRGEIVIKHMKGDAGEGQKAYTFDSVYDWNISQESIYKDAAFPIVDSVLEGYNGTIFAYGQTGTGKTHTMEGQPDPPELRGIIPRAFEHIFKHIEGTPGKQFLVRASFLELYNEEIRDLLSTNPKNKLELREKPDVGVYVKDLSSFPVQSVEEMAGKLTLGRKNRVVGETKMNRDSSRSHSLFSITVEASEFQADGENHIHVGKLNLVDLAGSERQSKTQATGDRFKEAISINQSLTTLGNVISALVDSKSTHVPYRDSKLTRLLQDSLGGNTKTVMVANIGPADWNYDETLSTLRYAHRAKSIKNKPKINEDPKDAMLREFQEEIQRLKAQLEQIGGPGGPDGMVGEGGEIVVKKIVKVEDEQKIKEMEEKLAKEKEEITKRNEEERKKIEAQKNLAEEEKQKLLENLRQKEEAEQAAKQNQEKLIKKLKKMEEKLLVGTQAMEQAVKQEKEYQKAKKELEEKKAQESKLAEELVKKEEENILMEKKFSSQQEEIEDKKKKLQKLYKKFQETNQELEDRAEEFNQERETYLNQLTDLTRQLKLTNLMIDHFIPQEELNKIEYHSAWSEEIDDWILPNPHLSGNSLRAKRPSSAYGMKRNERNYDDHDQHPKVPSLGLPEDEEDISQLEPEPNVYYVYKDDGIQREDNQTAKEKPKRTASAKKSAQGARKKMEIQPRETSSEDNFPKAKGLVKKSSKLS